MVPTTRRPVFLRRAKGVRVIAAIMLGLCVVAAALITAMSVVRWYRNPEYLRWLRIEKRARVRAAAARASTKYASLPAITVAPPLVPLLRVEPASAGVREGGAVAP